MSFDEMYDEMLHGEFSSRGKHQAKAVAAEPELTQSASRGRHAAAEEPATERPRGLQRYRTAGLVGAGGLACAAAGAFLGGLGGYFTISPAAAHGVAVPTITRDLPLAQAINQASHSSSGKGTSAVMAAEFSKVSGSLTKGIAPFASLTSEPFGNFPVNGLPGLGGTGGGGNGTVGGNGGNGTVPPPPPPPTVTGCTSGSSGLDLNCIVSGLTGVLTNLSVLTGGGTPVGTLVPTLDGVVTDLTSTLENLTALLPIASLPLPSGGAIPTTVLAGNGGGGPVTGVPATTNASGTNPIVSALSPVLDTVGSVTGALGSTGTPTSSLPLPTTTGTTLPTVPLSGTTTPTTTLSSGSGSGSTVTVPLPVPLPSTQTLTVGGLSVGVSSTGSTSGLTLTLP
jgi:hypothetical protein